jgi:ParB-like chromosome segregation protein Spo0J
MAASQNMTMQDPADSVEGGIQTDLVPVEQLQPAEWNPRTIDDKRFKQLVQSLRADPGFLWGRPILANKRGIIYAGNMRYRAAVVIGWTEVPARISNISDQQAKERALRDNNGFGDWQDQELAEMLLELKQEGSDLSSLGFKDRQLNDLLMLVQDTPEDEEEAADYKQRFELIVECQSEQQLQERYERLTQEGMKCRVLTL